MLDVLSVGTDDWLATIQQTDEDIKNITNILGDYKCKDAVGIFKSKLVNGWVYRRLSGRRAQLLGSGPAPGSGVWTDQRLHRIIDAKKNIG